MPSMMRAHPADEQPTREERLRNYRLLAREMQYPVDPPTDRDIDIMFDLSVKYVDELVPRYNETMDLIAMVIPSKTSQVLAAIIILDLASATFSKLKEHYARSSFEQLQELNGGGGIPPEVKELMAAMGLTDADIAGFMDMLQGKPNDG